MIISAIVGFALLLTACGGSDNADPTPTQEAAAVEATSTVVEATATEEPSTPTSIPTPTPEPEPSATATRSGPAPTVSAPIRRPPTEVPPAATPEPEPEPTQEVVSEEPEPTQEVPSEESGQLTVGELLLNTDLSDWEQVEFEFGSGFVAGGTYHLNVTEPEGAFIILRSNEAGFGNVQVTLDVRMVTESTEAYGCVTARADVEYQFNYAMCIGAQGQTRAIYEYFDAEGNYFSETLFDFEVREGTNAPTEWNKLQIVAYGTNIGFFVNDTFLGYATHSGPATGAAGFYVENYDPNGSEFEFTNLQVWELK